MEHTHPHTHLENQKNENFNLPLTIIISAILISASIFYNTRVIVNELSGAKSIGQNAGNLTAPNQIAQAPSVPSGPVDVNERKDAASLGSKNAKVAIVEFTDFQCPFCQRFFKDTYFQIKSKYIDTGKVRIIFRHYPLPFHANAQKAGEAAECANRQGKFIQYHDVLFEKMQADGTGLDVASLKIYAKDLGLNTSKFNQCLDRGETTEVVKKDMADGQAAGVSGTPTFFVNGIKLVGAQPMSAFEQAIDAALK